MPIVDVDAMCRAGQRLRELGPNAVLLKGGHLKGSKITDLLISEDGVERFEAARLHTRNTHGTGCTLASAVATGLTQGLPLRAAVVRALAYVQQAIHRAPGLGQGHGPLNHGHTVQNFGDGIADSR